jgi:hypothetical protein
LFTAASVSSHKKIAKTASPLSYILQAAMGQCSTLPAEARTSSSVASTRHTDNSNNPAYQQKDSNAMMLEQRHRLKEEGRKESLDFNKLISHDNNANEEISTHQESKNPAMKMPNGHRMDQATGSAAASAAMIMATTPGLVENQARDPEAIRTAGDSPIPMDVESNRDESPPAPIALPPEHAIRTRCYKLNLDSDLTGFSGSSRQPICFGPFNEPPPYLTYSSSEDSSVGVNPTTVAIQTAQIFRGITVSRDGTILTQNARATRSNRGKGPKRGEKSRQAAKIDKAKDLVEETIASGKAPESDEPANMVSLVIVGEYDDMKYLVRDGSKKLREAEGLPDEHLLSINRLRAGSKASRPLPSSSATMVSPRKRVSPSLVNSQRNAALQNPEKIQVTPMTVPMSAATPIANPITALTGAGVPLGAPGTSNLPQSAPPKLKSHPRDTRPGGNRRVGGEFPKVRLDACHDFMDPRRASGGAGGEGDWSHAWNIWNCGGGGTVSPLQPSSPKETGGQSASGAAGTVAPSPPPVFEGRESYGNVTREGASATRAN